MYNPDMLMSDGDREHKYSLFVHEETSFIMHYKCACAKFIPIVDKYLHVQQKKFLMKI